MQCGCPVCGTWMGQVVKGLDSGCVCPECGYQCNACMGTNTVQPKGHYVLPENFAVQITRMEEAHAQSGKVQIDRESQQRMAMDKALGYLSLQDRTVSQMEQYLYDKGFDPEDVVITIDKLKGYGYLNDEAYAQRYVRELSEGKHLGRRAIGEKLYRRGIEKEISDRAIELVTEEQERDSALYWVKKSLPTGGDKTEMKKNRDRVARRLAAKGFSYDVIRFALQQYQGEEEVDEEV